MTPTPHPPAPDGEREAQPYPPQPFLREHKRSPIAVRDGLKAWLGDEIAYLENIGLTPYGEGSLSAFKRVAIETESLPDHRELTARAERAEAEAARLRGALNDLLDMCMAIGTFSNGVTDGSGTRDEGDYLASCSIDRARAALAASGGEQSHG